MSSDVRDEHLRARPIKKYDIQLLLPAGHPLAGRSAVRLRDIADETFVEMPVGFGQREVVDDAFTRAELTRRVLIEVSDITTIPDYVAHGLGVAFLPSEFAKSS
ncbi:LysR substrate-binding domain-containing protein [Streptomyces sp. M10(2022)]